MADKLSHNVAGKLRHNASGKLARCASTYCNCHSNPNNQKGALLVACNDHLYYNWNDCLISGSIYDVDVVVHACMTPCWQCYTFVDADFTHKPLDGWWYAAVTLPEISCEIDLWADVSWLNGCLLGTQLAVQVGWFAYRNRYVADAGCTADWARREAVGATPWGDCGGLHTPAANYHATPTITQDVGTGKITLLLPTHVTHIKMYYDGSGMLISNVPHAIYWQPYVKLCCLSS